MPEDENTALARRWFDDVWNQGRLVMELQTAVDGR
jgi:hypothetical protein